MASILCWSGAIKTGIRRRKRLLRRRNCYETRLSNFRKGYNQVEKEGFRKKFIDYRKPPQVKAQCVFALRCCIFLQKPIAHPNIIRPFAGLYALPCRVFAVRQEYWFCRQQEVLIKYIISDILVKAFCDLKRGNLIIFGKHY